MNETNIFSFGDMQMANSSTIISIFYAIVKHECTIFSISMPSFLLLIVQ
jgi:hypothetical protein